MVWAYQKESTASLRTSFAGLLDTTRAIFAADARAFMGVGLVCLAPLFVYELLVFLLVAPATLSNVWLAEIIVRLPAYLIGVLALGGWVALARAFFSGEPLSAMQAVGKALSLTLSLMAAGIVVLVGWSVLFIFIIVPGVWFYVAFVLVYPALVEGKGFGEALRIAPRASAGAFWRIAGALIVIAIVLWVPRFILSLIAHFVFGLSISAVMVQSATSTGGEVAAAAVAFTAGVAAGPVFGILLEVLYHDRVEEGKVTSAA